MRVAATRARDDADLRPQTPINCSYKHFREHIHQYNLKLDARVQNTLLAPHRRRRTGQHLAADHP